MPIPLQPIIGLTTEKALPGVAASTAIFSDAPDDLKLIILTVRNADLTIRFDGNAPVFGSQGHLYPIGRHEFEIGTATAKAIRAIDSAGAATGWVTYVV